VIEQTRAEFLSSFDMEVKKTTVLIRSPVRVGGKKHNPPTVWRATKSKTQPYFAKAATNAVEKPRLMA
jgi:hypothetical protein